MSASLHISYLRTIRECKHCHLSSIHFMQHILFIIVHYALLMHGRTMASFGDHTASSFGSRK